MRTLVLGGARSGKTRYAEQLAKASEKSVIYIATATMQDDEMRSRIERHRADRPAHWKTIEESMALATALQGNASVDHCIVVDCLTLWLSNCLGHSEATGADVWRRNRDAFLQLLPQLPGELVFVSNETGLGVVPMGQLSRRFVDESGWLHQALAQSCERVVMTVAGLPQYLKGSAV